MLWLLLDITFSSNCSYEKTQRSFDKFAEIFCRSAKKNTLKVRKKEKRWLYQQNFASNCPSCQVESKFDNNARKFSTKKQIASPGPKMKIFLIFWDEDFFVKIFLLTLRQQVWQLNENFLPDEQKISLAQFPKRYWRRNTSNNSFFIKSFPWTRRQPFLQHARESMGGSRKRVISVLEVVEQTMNLKKLIEVFQWTYKMQFRKTCWKLNARKPKKLLNVQEIWKKYDFFHWNCFHQKILMNTQNAVMKTSPFFMPGCQKYFSNYQKQGDKNIFSIKRNIFLEFSQWLGRTQNWHSRRKHFPQKTDSSFKVRKKIRYKNFFETKYSSSNCSVGHVGRSFENQSKTFYQKAEIFSLAQLSVKINKNSYARRKHFWQLGRNIFLP